jgi:nucleotide-binding universal stress UspA family protein
LADALPILRQAKSVRLGAITNEKAIPSEPPPMEVVSHLAVHGIGAAYDAVDADGRDAGTALIDYLRRWPAELRVTGGYGNSRLRELILGGATRRMLRHLPVPVFMAH